MQCLRQGQQGDYYLAVAKGQNAPNLYDSNRGSAKSGGYDRPTTPTSQDASAFASTSHLHKQLLAQEVIKLRREVAQLRAAQGLAPGHSQDDATKSLQMEVAKLQAQKAEVIAQANASKAMLAKEVKSLRAELDRVGGSEGRYAGADPVPDTTALTDGEQVRDSVRTTHSDDVEARRAAGRCDTHVAMPCVLEYL